MVGPAGIEPASLKYTTRIHVFELRLNCENCFGIAYLLMISLRSICCMCTLWFSQYNLQTHNWIS